MSDDVDEAPFPPVNNESIHLNTAIIGVKTSMIILRGLTEEDELEEGFPYKKKPNCFA